jgi:hypothetical protein
MTAEHAVHSLEHGTVWLTYNPALGADAARLTEQAKGQAVCPAQPGQGPDRPGDGHRTHLTGRTPVTTSESLARG